MPASTAPSVLPSGAARVFSVVRSTFPRKRDHSSGGARRPLGCRAALTLSRPAFGRMAYARPHGWVQRRHAGAEGDQ